MLLLLLACATRPPAAPPRWDRAASPVVGTPVEGLEDGRVRLVARAGSAYDPPAREGLAFVAAQVLLLQTPGASLEVGQEVVRLELPRDSLPQLARALREPAPEAILASARARAQEALALESCEDAARLAWTLTAWAGHPYGHAAAGRSSVWPTITPEEVRAFHDARWVREAVRLGAAPGPSVDATPLQTLPARISRSPVPAPSHAAMPRSFTVRAALPEGHTGCSLTARRVARPAAPERVDLLAPALAGAPLGTLRLEPWEELSGDAAQDSPGWLTVHVLPSLPTHGAEEGTVSSVPSLGDFLR
jgi:hypothetical protein